MLTIKQFQEEQKAWVAHNFPTRPNYQPLLGLIEETGELSHHVLKMQQKIRGTAEEHLAEIQDAVADLVVFHSDYCTAMGWELRALLAYDTFHEVQTYSRIDTSLAGWQDHVFSISKAVNDIVMAHVQMDILKGRTASVVFVHTLACFCKECGWSLQELLEETWAKVKKRDWRAKQRSENELKPFTFTPDKVGKYLVTVDAQTGRGSVQFVGDGLLPAPRHVVGIDTGIGVDSTVELVIQDGEVIGERSQ